MHVKHGKGVSKARSDPTIQRPFYGPRERLPMWPRNHGPGIMPTGIEKRNNGRAASKNETMEGMLAKA